jgi:DNA-binding transcriptional ArsR family regulator
MTIEAKHPFERYEARARIAKALAHPTRLMMLDVLAEREWCVCDLTELAQLDQIHGVRALGRPYPRAYPQLGTSHTTVHQVVTHREWRKTDRRGPNSSRSGQHAF